MTGTRAEWELVLQEQAASGKSVAAFCRERGLSESSLGYWRGKLNRVKRGAFVKVGEAARIEIELPSGAKLRIPCDAPSEVLHRILETVNAVAC
jgi:hypothetical protein